MDEEVLSALLRRAKGYSYNEVQEEFAVKEDGELALVKRKVLEKYCPPDSAALKTYLELNRDRSVEDLSDEELERERVRLLNELKSEEIAQKNEKSTEREGKKSPLRKKGVK